MSLDGRTLAFVGIAALLTITPGPDMALVTRAALARGRRSAFQTSLGVVSGLLVWGVASAVGVAAVLAAFTALTLVGAAYLVLVGLQALWRTRRLELPAPRPPLRGSAYAQGLANNLLNPKIAVFYTTFLPQFVEPGESALAKTVTLAAIHGVLGLVWLAAYAHAVTRARGRLERPRVRRAVERVTGCVLLAFGVRLAVARR